jgi:AcrR family transcriptional regulator
VQKTLSSTQATLANLDRNVTHGDRTLQRNFTQAWSKCSAQRRHCAVLSDYLQQHPESLLRGKPADADPGKPSEGGTMTRLLPASHARRRGAAIGIAVLALLAGCGSAQPPRYHTLMPAPASTARTPAPAGSLAWEVLPVAVPAGVDQPQWVVRTVDGSLAVLEQERWIAPLGEEIRAAVADRLTQDIGTPAVVGRVAQALAHPDRRAPVRLGARTRSSPRSDVDLEFRRRRSGGAALPWRVRAGAGGGRLSGAGHRSPASRRGVGRCDRQRAQGAERRADGNVQSPGTAGSPGIVAGAEMRHVAHAPPSAPRAKPLKRPSQARARFTVQAIYDAFVRIWRAEGWERLTTRAVALETGISVGTLYEYFPNKQALLSGYVRQGVDAMLAAIDKQVVQATIRRGRNACTTCCGSRTASTRRSCSHYDAQMLALEHQIAEPKHHRRVHDEIVAAWSKALNACADLPHAPSARTVQTLCLSAFGGRRYLMLVHADDATARAWAAELERQCRLVLSTPSNR